jgi:glycosyltransferase involved in cell wall biosynthesis
MSAPGFGDRSPGHWVVVTTSYPARPGDADGHFVAAEVAELRALGRRVIVLAPRTSDEPPCDPDVRLLPGGGAFGWPGVLTRLRERPWRALGAFRFVLAARRELARHDDVDRVIAHFVVPSAWPIATRRTRAPLEVVAHGSDVRLIERLPWPVRRLIARALAGANIRCVSEELRLRLDRALVPLTRVRFEVAPTPLAITAAPTRSEARALLGVGEGTRLLVVVGRLLRSKRVDVALRAATLVPDATAVVVGDGPERSRLERLFPEVRFVGTVPRARALAWIAAADALLSASALEGAPSVVREARALGTRVVARRAGDLDAWSLRDPGLHVLEGSS